MFNSDTTAAVNASNEVISIAGQFFAGAAAPATRSKARARTGAVGTNLASAEDGDRAGGVRSDEHRYIGERLRARERSARQRRVSLLRLPGGAERQAPAVRAADPRQGRDVPARPGRVRAGLLPRDLDQGLSRVQLRDGRRRRARRAVPEEPHLARVLQVPRAQHRLAAVPAARRPGAGIAASDGRAGRLPGQDRQGKARQDREPAPRRSVAARRRRRRPTATTASRTPTSRRPPVSTRAT